MKLPPLKRWLTLYSDMFIGMLPGANPNTVDLGLAQGGLTPAPPLRVPDLYPHLTPASLRVWTQKNRKKDSESESGSERRKFQWFSSFDCKVQYRTGKWRKYASSFLAFRKPLPQPVEPDVS